ncbi:MAG: hypothetical protein PVSMB7_17860 [Chloroflexota bacterium]
MKGSKNMTLTPQKANGRHVGALRPRALHPGNVNHSRLLESEHAPAQLRDAESASSIIRPAPYSAYGGYRELTAWPATVSHTQFTRDALQHAITTAAGRNRARSFLPQHAATPLAATRDGYEYTGDEKNGAVQWHIQRSGLLRQRTSMTEDAADGTPAPCLSVDATVEYVAGAIDCAGRLYTALEDAKSVITLRFRMTTTHGRTLAASFDPSSHRYTCMLPDIEYEITVAARTLRDERTSLVTAVVRDMLQQCNWADPPTHTLRALIDAHVTRTIYRHYRANDAA